METRVPTWQKHTTHAEQSLRDRPEKEEDGVLKNLVGIDRRRRAQRRAIQFRGEALDRTSYLFAPGTGCRDSGDLKVLHVKQCGGAALELEHVDFTLDVQRFEAIDWLLCGA